MHEPKRYGLTKPGMVLHPQFDAPGDGGSGNETAGVEEMYYSVSVFHQLHCLGVIRRGYYGGVRGVGVGDGDVGGSGEHIGHCFDYLRQAVQCSESFLPLDPGFRFPFLPFFLVKVSFGEANEVGCL